MTLAADMGAWPFLTPAWRLTAAQRAWLIATQQEKKSHEEPEEPVPMREDELIERFGSEIQKSATRLAKPLYLGPDSIPVIR